MLWARLASISDSAPASQKMHGFNTGSGGAGYTYDANGNLKTDSYKGITNITYNHLNLPNVITFSSGNSIEWIYDAAGMKLRKIVKQGATVQYEQTYAGGMEYRKNGTGSNRVEALYHAEGRYLNLNAEVNNTLLWQKEYALRDHLGNTRMMFADKNANGIVETPSEITQENHYYPFGLGYEGPWLMNDAVARDNKYQYNGKEWNDDWGLKWNDYGARWYMADVGRWGAVDPAADKYFSWSPYNYVLNNPLRNTDPKGDTVRVYTESIAGGLGRHAYIRVTTCEYDKIVELWGPNPEELFGGTGFPRVDDVLSDGQVLGRKGAKEVSSVERPEDSPEGDWKFEERILALGEFFAQNSEVCDGEGNKKKFFPNAPEYGTFGPNSNGYVNAIIEMAGGKVDLPLIAVAANDTEEYKNRVEKAEKSKPAVGEVKAIRKF